MNNHLTGIENIENIIREGLLSRSSLLSRNQIFEDVADPEIIRFRREHGLNDYVPFHFFLGILLMERSKRCIRRKSSFICVCIVIKLEI
ncbi:MAG: DUF4433 domain-containing protein [Clostridium sp.]|nr:DUF4433 domain-containing protein [Clostridium sp.]